MPISISQRTFTGGEWSPSLDPRTDLAKYGTAVKKMRNFFPHAHGGASNRAGKDYVVELKSSSAVGRLVPFQFSVVQSYILEFGNLFIRFVKDGGQIVSAKAITGAVDNGSGLIRITSASHGFQSLNTVAVASVGGVPAATGTWVITVINANTYDLVGSTFAGTYTSGGTGTAIVEVETPYITADLPLLKFRQSADTLYITHPGYARRKLTRSSHTAWTLTTITAGSTLAAPANMATTSAGSVVYAVTAMTSEGVESVPSTSVASTNTATLSWDAVTGADGYTVYQQVNGIYKFLGDAIGLSFVLTAAMVADADIAAPESQDPYGSSGNYPGCAAFFKQRLLFARTDNAPQTIGGSRIGDFENNNISTPVQDDDAYTVTIDSDQVNEIKWMERLNDLIIGTSGGEFKLAAGENTPTSLKLTDQSSWGTCDIQPIKIGTSLIFVDGSQRRVRDLIFSFAIDGYDGSDLTILAQHLFETSQIKEWAYARQPDSIVWVVRDDGIGCGLTYNKEHQVNGWFTIDTDGLYESVATIQTSGGENDVYFIVNRTIGGATKRYIEKLHARDFVDIEDAYFVDCGLTYDGSVAKTLTPGTGALTQGTLLVNFTAGSSTFVVGDVGRFIHYRYATGEFDDSGIPLYLTARAEITDYTSATVVRCTIRDAFPSLSLIASGDWRMTVTGVSGLSHLEGETLVALTDGYVTTDLVVASGAVTLPYPASKIQIGLPYTCDLHSLGFEYPTREGVIQDKVRDINLVTVNLRNSREMFVGPDADHLIEAKFRTNEVMGDPIRLFTGPKPVTIPPGTLNEARVFIRTVSPVPITVAAITPQLTNGRI